MEFKNLFIWQKATELAESIYSLAYKIPLFEKYGLGRHLRRAFDSVLSNIAGDSARCSLAEAITQVELAKNSVI